MGEWHFRRLLEKLPAGAYTCDADGLITFWDLNNSINVGPGKITDLNATGYIVAAHKIQVASKVLGRVAWIGVDKGDKVKQGQVIARLEDDEYKARVTQSQGQLDAAKAKLDELQAGSRPEECRGD